MDLRQVYQALYDLWQDDMEARKGGEHYTSPDRRTKLLERAEKALDFLAKYDGEE